MIQPRRVVRATAEYRLLIGTGTLVAGFSVIGQLAPDGAVELAQLDIDRDLDW